MSSPRQDEPAPAGDGAITAPPTIDWAFWATIAWAALSVLSAVSLATARPYLRQALIDANAKSKTPVADYTAAKVDYDITHTYLIGGSIQAVLLAVILVVLGLLIRRGRGWARWLLLAFATFIPLVIPLGIGIVLQLLLGVISDAPVLYRVLRIAAGLASVAVVVLLLMPRSSSYFAASRALAVRNGVGRRPAGATAGGGARGRMGPGAATTGRGTSAGRPGGLFGTLFTPRRPAPGPLAGTGETIPDPAITDGRATLGSTTGTRARRAVATRPGSVRPKGAGGRTGRSKSRQESSDSNSADSD